MKEWFNDSNFDANLHEREVFRETTGDEGDVIIYTKHNSTVETPDGVDSPYYETNKIKEVLEDSVQERIEMAGITVAFRHNERWHVLIEHEPMFRAFALKNIPRRRDDEKFINIEEFARDYAEQSAEKANKQKRRDKLAQQIQDLEADHATYHDRYENFARCKEHIDAGPPTEEECEELASIFARFYELGGTASWWNLAEVYPLTDYTTPESILELYDHAKEKFYAEESVYSEVKSNLERAVNQLREKREEMRQIEQALRGYDSEAAAQEMARSLLQDRTIRQIEYKNQTLHCRTRPVTLETPDGNHSVPLGEFELRIPIPDIGRATIHGYKDNVRANGYIHPHVNTGGNVCWGGFSGPKDTAVRSGSIQELISIMVLLLNRYNDRSAYVDILLQLEEQQ